MPDQGEVVGAVADCSAVTLWRNRGGITGMTFASARAEASATPATGVCAQFRRPMVTETASSWSSTRGGSGAPWASW
ncbi:MAG: hypothetical protein L0J74_13500 [Corynebacterium sp.]|uniref:hypothetical protein n=1 Tax=Corynebacterium sp. TaxID=1720 RepID=UPI002648019F|nr:hypothetical protein [Corynebacterium sp.]MDN6306790.1 hypothetical protein [Corynebacterium sp.]